MDGEQVLSQLGWRGRMAVYWAVAPRLVSQEFLTLAMVAVCSVALWMARSGFGLDASVSDLCSRAGFLGMTGLSIWVGGLIAAFPVLKAWKAKGMFACFAGPVLAFSLVFVYLASWSPYPNQSQLNLIFAGLPLGNPSSLRALSDEEGIEAKQHVVVASKRGEVDLNFSKGFKASRESVFAEWRRNQGGEFFVFVTVGAVASFALSIALSWLGALRPKMPSLSLSWLRVGWRRFPGMPKAAWRDLCRWAARLRVASSALAKRLWNAPASLASRVLSEEEKIGLERKVLSRHSARGHGGNAPPRL